MKLRDYQEKAIAAILKFWERVVGQNPALVLPTGAGKTIVFSFLIKRLFEKKPGARVLVMAHRKELISQAEEKLLSVWPDAPVGVYSAGLGRRELKPVTVASRDTLKNAIKKHDFSFDYVIIDECHNISPDDESGYQQILKELKNRNRSLKVLGVTATPYRATSGTIVGPDQILNHIAFEVKIKELIDRGFLVRIKAPEIRKGEIDTSKVKIVGSDFKRSELDGQATKTNKVKTAIAEWKRHRKIEGFNLTVFFAVSVAHAELISEELTRQGFYCPVIHANTPDYQRAEILLEAKHLRIDTIVNVGVLTEGTDIPPIDCIALLRPTRSLGLYLQIVGRGLRLSPETNKKYCTLLDFGGNMKRFGPIDQAQPAPKNRKDCRTQICDNCKSTIGMYVRKCPECDFEFFPVPAKECPDCLTMCAPSASVCHACNSVFISHDEIAAAGRVFSDDSPPEKIMINSSTLHVRSESGANYVSLAFHAGARVAVKHLYIGYPGLAGEKASEDWTAIMEPGTPLPANPNEAARIYDANRYIFREVESVLVDPIDRHSFAKLITIKGGDYVR
ncbi:MAG: DEAD/DEAH box helicase [Planctomycetaceae bacterium]|nr:DEAD/DEAH box helicase [Planctomycetaceae bacterium]